MYLSMGCPRLSWQSTLLDMRPLNDDQLSEIKIILLEVEIFLTSSRIYGSHVAVVIVVCPGMKKMKEPLEMILIKH